MNDVEDLVETIMRTYGSYEDYSSEEKRQYWRNFLTKKESENDETMVREQPGAGESNC